MVAQSAARLAALDWARAIDREDGGVCSVACGRPIVGCD